MVAETPDSRSLQQDSPDELSKSQPQDAPVDGEVDEETGNDALINLTIVLPEPGNLKIQIVVSPQEQVHELRQSIIDLPAAFQYTCFHLEYKGNKINDFIPIADIPDLDSEPRFDLVEDPYTEREARIHVVRIRDLIGAATDRVDTTQGVLSGFSLFESIEKVPQPDANGSAEQNQTETATVESYDFGSNASATNIIPKSIENAPKTVKSISLSHWNPPPCHLHQRGHLLYLVLTTAEGEQIQITSHVSGFFANKSSNAKFDPFPRSSPKAYASHSLLDLIGLLSPSFQGLFQQLMEHNSTRDPLATFQITNTIPSVPWTVPVSASAISSHASDATRTQETYLLAGVDNTDTLRDWNEEFQSAKELPKETVQDRVFRERLISKLFADYNDAATKGAVLVARGEIAPLNPTECLDAQIFVYNNIFFSFGADGVGTFTSEGGDEAARVATGKDVAGVRLVNQLDIDGLFTPATVVVDYLGKRVVGQSIVPGIFKQREPGENQIDYGAVDGKDLVAADARFAPSFALLSKALKVKQHPVWDKNGKRFDLEASVETKGLMGTDGRKYVLDLYRVTPFDIPWLEDHCEETSEDGQRKYPHRMTVLRPELVDAFGRYKMKQWVDAELAKQPEKQKTEEESSEGTQAEQRVQPDLSKFRFALNPDVFSGQVPQTEDEQKESEEDERDVRDACNYLQDQVIPGLLRELTESDISFPMDGPSMGRLFHKRGINMRYLGKVATLATGDRLSCLRQLCIQDMIARAFKHVSALHLRSIPGPLAPACLSHLLNCLLGSNLNSNPKAEIDTLMRSLYSDADLTFENVTPQSLQAAIEEEIFKRFRFTMGQDWASEIRPLQLLRDVSLRMGLQIQAKDFVFNAQGLPLRVSADTPSATATGQTNGDSKKKKKKTRDTSPPTSGPKDLQTFSPDDVVDIVPVVKHSSPRSSLAEEALEAGRISLLQNQRKLGQELLLESLSLHEQIYGILHPEVARVYNSLSMLYYQLDDKDAAVELARKAIIVSERTVGVDSAETLLNYLNLSLFLHQAGDSKSALLYSKHALMLWKVIYGPGHPDSITTINNAAVMLQHLKAYHESRLWFEESLRVCESVFGKQSINSATLLFQLAQALALDQDSKGAVNRMKESYNIFLAELGADDKNTKEAESWLEQLTHNAVSIAKHAKDAESRRIRSGIRFPTASSAQQLSSSQPLTTSSQVDSRSIDELINFIEGNDQTAKSKKRPSKGNPKRRGRAA